MTGLVTEKRIIRRPCTHVSLKYKGKKKAEGRPMLCQRCSGPIVYVAFGDLRKEADRMCIVTRCINWGCIEDAVLRANRLRPRAAKRSVSNRTVRRGGVVFIKNHSEEYGTI